LHKLQIKTVLHKLLADIVLLSHLAFILFVMFGALMVLYRRWVAWLHIPMVLWSSVVNITPWLCPLTPLENYFHRQAGEAGYEGGFIAHYIAPLIYPEGMSYDMGMMVGVFVFIWNVLIYSLVMYRIRHATRT
jgi:hypothetical protein